MGAVAKSEIWTSTASRLGVPMYAVTSQEGNLLASFLRYDLPPVRRRNGGFL